ncbi:MAG: hypothetical protein ABH828_03610 [archaeon]
MKTISRIIRHGHKQTVKNHKTGTEAGLDKSKIYLIKDYAQKIYLQNKGAYKIDAASLPRNHDTSKIISEELRSISNNVSGPNIDERLAPFTGKNGETVLISSELPEIWGKAEKEYQTVEGIEKEDRGMLAWAKYGLDKKTDGITLKESAYRIGDYILENILEENDQIIGVSNSGFIEPFMYATLDMIEGKDKSPVEYFYETGGAVKPLEGLDIIYQKGYSIANMVLPTKKIVSVDIDILKEQKEWLKKYSVLEEVKENGFKMETNV